MSELRVIYILIVYKLIIYNYSYILLTTLN